MLAEQPAFSEKGARMARSSRQAARPKPTLLTELEGSVIGQPQALSKIAPFVQMYRVGLAPEGRPAGVFLLLGSTGTGKTRTVEVLAKALHGSERSLLRVDCGEYQMEHEVAKLIGAPPGYLGHRETQPVLSQQKLTAVTSESSRLSLILLDEIEKAAPSMTRLLLGVLDKATLRLGDNSTVNFENSMIFMTSNLGAEAMRKELSPDFGFEQAVVRERVASEHKLAAIGTSALKRRFSPEFVNRVDAVVTYLPLEKGSLREILDLLLADLKSHLWKRLANQGFDLDITPEACELLLVKGTSREYGARELKRTILRLLTQPLAAKVDNAEFEAGAVVRVLARGEALEFEQL